MLRLKSLGQTLIEVDDARLTPAAETLFATALYLIMEAGRPVSREELARIIWPGVSEAKAQHGLRQVLYKLRAMGVEIIPDRLSLTLSPRGFSADYASLLTAHGTGSFERIAEQLEGVFLPGYRPQFSVELSARVERQRDVVHSAMMRALVVGIGEKKKKSDWSGAERLARMCLNIDPLNEEATLTIAEAMALGGSKTKALSILSSYLDEIGTKATDIRLPALTLQRRISEVYPNVEASVTDTPFVGRESELEELTRGLANARKGDGRAFLIWGEPGIGKTRLVTEFTRAALLGRGQVVKVVCQSHDAKRPLSIFVDLVPKLLQLSGALGCSPESMRYLRLLTSPVPEELSIQEDPVQAESRYARTRLAILDILDAVSAELCCILVLENSHWLDEQSARLLNDLFEWLRSRNILLALTSRSQTWTTEGLSQLHLRPLPSSACHVVALAAIGPQQPRHEDFVDWCVRTSGGNPFFLQELLRHGGIEHDGFRPPTSLTRLLQDRVLALAGESRRLLEICCVLGKHSTLDRVQACAESNRLHILGALTDLETRGLIQLEGDHVLSRHDLLTSVVLDQMGRAAKAMLHRFIAQQLEAEEGASDSIGLMWECAEHWCSASEPAHAVHLLRKCGSHLMEVGMPFEAAEVLGRAATLAAPAAEKYQIGAQRVRALMHAEREDTCLEELESLIELRDAIAPAPFPLDEVGWMRLKARSNRGALELDLLSETTGILATGEGSTQDRVRAAEWLLVVADNICDISLGHRIYDLVAPSIDAASIAVENQLAFELVYHCSFGDPLKSVALAHELLERARDYNHVPFAIRYMRYAAHTFLCHSTPNEAVSTYLLACQTARALNAPVAMANCACYLVEPYLQLGDLDSAEQYLNMAIASHSPDGRTLLDAEILNVACEIAIKQKDLPTARTYLSRLMAAVQTRHIARRQARLFALPIAFALASGTRIPSDELERLEGAFAETCRSTNQDFVASTLIRALVRSDRMSEAQVLVSRYTERDRRDLAPHSVDLTQAILELSARG